MGQELVSYLAPMDETTEFEAIELNEYIDTLSERRADEQDPLQRGPWMLNNDYLLMKGLYTYEFSLTGTDIKSTSSRTRSFSSSPQQSLEMPEPTCATHKLDYLVQA